MSKVRQPKEWALVISCEHASWHIPNLFMPQMLEQDLTDLTSHRGWDIGALPIARALARSLKTKCFASKVSRLLVDCNRSTHHVNCLGLSFRKQTKAERNFILARYYWPHRNAVEEDIKLKLAQGRRVLHIAVHSFTPELNGDKRNADLAFLYDPARAHEKMWANRFLAELADEAPELRLRRNYPYLGTADAFGTSLRRYYKAAQYVSLEIEINQALLVNAATAQKIQKTIVSTMKKALQMK